MHEDRTTTETVEALPLEDRAAAYLVAQRALEERLQLPAS